MPFPIYIQFVASSHDSKNGMQMGRIRDIRKVRYFRDAGPPLWRALMIERCFLMTEDDATFVMYMDHGSRLYLLLQNSPHNNEAAFNDMTNMH